MKRAMPVAASMRPWRIHRHERPSAAAPGAPSRHAKGSASCQPMTAGPRRRGAQMSMLLTCTSAYSAAETRRHARKVRLRSAVMACAG